jgi:cholesterol transport system auxiliary component
MMTETIKLMLRKAVAKRLTLGLFSLFIFTSTLMLTSCFSPVKTNPPNKYFLDKPANYVPNKKMRPITLLISLPDTRPAFNTTQMAYSIRPYEISYYAQNQWAEAPVDMFQVLLVQALQQTHHFKAVITPPYTAHYDYVLNTQILDFLQDFTHGAPHFVMTVRVQIYKTSTNQVIGTRQFTVAQPMLRASPYAGVIAANCAASIMLEKIAAFSLERV